MKTVKPNWKKVNQELSYKYSEVMSNKILSEVQGLEDTEDGGLSNGKLWRLKKKLCPKPSEFPSAMQGSDDRLIATDEEILNEAVNHYQNVFKEREMEADLYYIKTAHEILCEERLNIAGNNKTPPWTIKDVTSVLKSLKTGKSKDCCDMPNEIFKPGVVGDDLVLAVTSLMNIIKYELNFQDPMNKCNVTNLFLKQRTKTAF